MIVRCPSFLFKCLTPGLELSGPRANVHLSVLSSHDKLLVFFFLCQVPELWAYFNIICQ